jgi:diguanylate cyclase (GGDEF)-like protein
VRISAALKEKYRLLQKLHILVVEDDRFAREQLGLLLSRFAKQLSTAGDGHEGLEKFQQERPDIVITDINMPHMDGLDLAKAIKTMEPATPVILVTAHSDTEFFLRSIDIGVDGYVVKPVVAEALLSLLAKQATNLLDVRAANARSRLFQFTLDINPNFILTLHAGTVDYVNRTFLNFLGATSLHALRQGKHTGRKLEIDGRRYAAADLAWTAQVGARQDATHQAVFPRLPGETGRDRTFLVSSADFPELDRRILTFTDITPLAEERQQLLIRAATDALTGIANRAGLADVLARELHRTNRHNAPLSVVMFDIDLFKTINDTYGHPAGDAVLVALTQLVAALVRDHDTLGRFGGEEFLIVAPETDTTAAEQLAERLRAAVENNQFPAAGRVTCSFGVATTHPGDSAETLVARVDAALYQAKEAGRNRVAVG